MYARDLFKSGCEFEVQAKFHLACNEKPEINTTDGGTWRRLVVVNYTSKFVDHPCEPHHYPIDETIQHAVTSREWATAFLNYLVITLKEGSGFHKLPTPKKVLEYTSEYRNDTDGIAMFLSEKTEEFNAGDEVLFYFSGHAVEIDGKNFLTPIDTIGISQNQLADDSIDLKTAVLDPLTTKKVKLTLALIDACRDNPFLKTASTRSNSNSRGLAPTTPATGQLIVYSAGSGQTALDRLGPNDKDKNGVFTRVLLSEMKKNNVPIHQVIRNVRSEVVKLARSIGHDQVPAIYDQVDGDFYFKK
jgi:hypothetical protein